MALFFELCVETVEAALAGQRAGADQVELCAGLACGGITPPRDQMIAAVRALRIPVTVLIRPRYGDFVFSAPEFDRMCRQVSEARDAGAAAVALGILTPDGCIDVQRTARLVELARPMQVTFHRAFDEAPDLAAALEDVIAAGASCLLTSGGCRDVLSGAAAIGRLREHAGRRLRVMAGGGLRMENLAEVVHRSGVTMLHSSLTREAALHPNGDGHSGKADTNILEADVREAIRLFHDASHARTVAAESAD